MKKHSVYSLVVFLVVATYLFFGLLTQLLMGVVKWEDAPLLLGMTVFFGALAGVIFFFTITKITEKFGSQEKNSSPYVLSGNFIAVSIVLIAISSTYGVMKSYSIGSEQKAAAEMNRDTIERLKLAAAKAAKAERQRIASLTPTQLAAEEKEKREKAEAVVKVAAEKAARIEAEKAKALADKNKRRTQEVLAAIGANQLKNAAKDPDTFLLKSLYLAPDGTACYIYRAKNSYNALLKGQAVLTTKGKMFIAEYDENRFANVWNKSCTESGGEELADIVKMSRLFTDGSDK